MQILPPPQGPRNSRECWVVPCSHGESVGVDKVHAAACDERDEGVGGDRDGAHHAEGEAGDEEVADDVIDDLEDYEVDGAGKGEDGKDDGGDEDGPEEDEATVDAACAVG